VPERIKATAMTGKAMSASKKTIKDVFNGSFSVSSGGTYKNFMHLYNNLRLKGVLARPVTHQVKIECEGRRGMPETIKIGTIATKSNKAIPPDQCEAYVWFNDHTKLIRRAGDNSSLESEFKRSYWSYNDTCCRISGVQNRMNKDLVGAECLLLAGLLNVPGQWGAAIDELLTAVTSD
jgi:hypothetical protein